jgi:hypothetical protein
MHEFGKSASYLHVSLLVHCILLICSFIRCDKFVMFLRSVNCTYFMLQSLLHSPTHPTINPFGSKVSKIITAIRLAFTKS